MLWFKAEVLNLKLVIQFFTKVIGNIFIGKINKNETIVTTLLFKNICFCLFQNISFSIIYLY